MPHVLVRLCTGIKCLPCLFVLYVRFSSSASARNCYVERNATRHDLARHLKTKRIHVATYTIPHHIV